MSSTFALNPAVSPKYLFNLIYDRFFADEFIRQGKKLFRKKEEKDSDKAELIKFLLKHEEVNSEKLFNSFGVRSALKCAYKYMTRVSEKLFVKDSLIQFNVAGTDEALTAFVQGKIVSLRTVTSFTGFPPVKGYSWNLYMLESFLRKYSQRYFYDTPAYNNSNVGVIYPKSMGFENYIEVQSATLLQEDIPLEKVAVEKFLIEHGYRITRVDTVTEQIIARARELLDERSLN